MGCTNSKESAANKASTVIDKELRHEKAELNREVKILILGAGESGKSTIIKQMKLINDTGFSDEDRENYIGVIRCTSVTAMRAIVEAMDRLEIKLANSELESDKEYILEQSIEMGTIYEPKVFVSIQKLWKDDGVIECFNKSYEYQLTDSAEYFFNIIDAVGKSDYRPSDQDILHCRIKTTGINETVFNMGEYKYRMFDVGGQRSERKKWIHCFENVTAVLFLVAISEYDQKLHEDETVNRMDESLVLFDSICNSKWFQSTAMLLFLNKIDLFEKKITANPIKNYFPEYSGQTLEDAKLFFAKKFTSINRNQGKQVYVHYTCATDTEQIKFVMAATNDIIVKSNLAQAGMF